MLFNKIMANLILTLLKLLLISLHPLSSQIYLFLLMFKESVFLRNRRDKELQVLVYTQKDVSWSDSAGRTASLENMDS